MFCKNCGKSLKENENFCPSCGEKIEKTSKIKIVINNEIKSLKG